ncbi:hypothetical protein AAF712_013656 [Marasmius tenuissimus]|uniref:F-box domain-containing protein n=1 Tax=Marasmius tenuissimus TaxID=585030 RepID=A0ABR2ZE31_9AGAR
MVLRKPRTEAGNSVQPESTKHQSEFAPQSSYPPISREQLRTDYLLSDSIRTEMFLIIAHEEQDLERYQTEIKRIKSLLNQLEQARTELENRIAQHRSFHSVIRRVPEELWVEIFVDCVQLTSRSSPCHLAAVCSHWRGIVRSKSKLWLSLVVRVDLRSGVNVPLLESYLSHSKDHPLEIVVRSHKPQFSSVTAHNLFIYSPSEQVMEKLVDHTGKLTVPSYESESTISPLPEYESRYLWIYDSVSTAPRLREVIIGSEHGKPLSLSMEWLYSSEVQSLTIHHLEGSAERRLLSVLPTLKQLGVLSISIKNAPSYRGGFDTAATVLCPRLRQLSFSCDQRLDNYLQTRWGTMRCPDLCSLTLSYPVVAQDSGLDPGFPRFSSSLTKLSFTFSISRQVGSHRPTSGLLTSVCRSLPNPIVFEIKFQDGTSSKFPDTYEQCVYNGEPCVTLLSKASSKSQRFLPPSSNHFSFGWEVPFLPTRSDVSSKCWK